MNKWPKHFLLKVTFFMTIEMAKYSDKETVISEVCKSLKAEGYTVNFTDMSIYYDSFNSFTKS